jgi:hypothetical protein
MQPTNKIRLINKKTNHVFDVDASSKVSLMQMRYWFAGCLGRGEYVSGVLGIVLVAAVI